jgi:hypothetical protein
MKCHFCDQEAVERCYQCGLLFCDKHGNANCVACDGGIAEGDPRRDRVSVKPMSPETRGLAWWRPISADEYVPPACYQCGGLTRSKCTSCGRQFCANHGSASAGRCSECQRSSNAGMLIGLGVIVLFVFMFLFSLVWAWLFA